MNLNAESKNISSTKFDNDQVNILEMIQVPLVFYPKK